MSAELADLVRRQGGLPHLVPAVCEIPIPCTEDVSRLIDGLTARRLSAVVFLTGVGAAALFTEAEKQQRLDSLTEGLRRVITICRGPKPSAVLHRYGVPIRRAAREPYTSVELIRAMEGIELGSRGIGLVHYGERDPSLAGAIAALGAWLEELCLYEWRLPVDYGPLARLVDEILGGSCGAIVFTSQIQCRHLFQVAAAIGRDVALADALNQRTVVASVGPVCTAALVKLGVKPHVVPERPKMGPLVSALADYFTNALLLREGGVDR